MQRDVQALAERHFDLLIIGGGVHGAAAAWDGALRGLSVALIERADFCSGNSANSLKTIHGGLRYLQNLDIVRVRQSITERGVLLRIAPHLVSPLPCLLPTYGHATKGPEALRAGLLLNDIIGLDRNRGLPADKRIPRGRVISARRVMETLPMLPPGKPPNGGAVWYDAQAYSTERLVISYALSAARIGAVAANYVEAVALSASADRVRGVRARDTLTGEEFDIRARLVLNCAGPRLAAILTLPGRPPLADFRLSTALNIIVGRPLVHETAAGFNSRFTHREPGGRERRGKRVLFMAPWRGRTIIGTQHRPFAGRVDDFRPSPEMIADFVAEVGAALPGARLEPGDVTFVHWGIVPMDRVDKRSGDPVITGRHRIIDHKKENGIEGLVSVLGVKFTTGRRVAARAVDLACRKLGVRAPSSSHRRPVAGGEMDSFSAFRDDLLRRKPLALDAPVLERLARLYGTLGEDIFALARDNPDLAAALPGSEGVLAAEIVHAARAEAAVKLADAVLRRTDLGSAGFPGEGALRECASLMAAELGWDGARIEQEIDEVRALYP